MQAACIREFHEETGIEIEVLEPIHCETSFFNPSHSAKYNNQYWNCPLIYFLVKIIGGEISNKYFDEEEKSYADLAKWIAVEKINDIKFIDSIINNIAIINKARKAMHDRRDG